MKTQSTMGDSPQKSTLLMAVFMTWSFILLCRPQDYFPFLEKLRLSLSLGLITLLVYLLSAKNSENIFNSNQFRLYVYLVIVMIIGIPFSFYRSASLNDVFNYASITTMFIFLFYQLVNTIEKLRSLLFMYCSGASIYAIYILNNGELTNNRIFFGKMFDPNDIVYFIISFLMFNLIFISKDNKSYVRFISVINIVISLIVIFKTGSRGGLIAVIAVLAYMLFVKTKTVKLSFMTKGALVVAAMVSMQCINLNSERYKTILDLKDDYNVTDEEGRIAVWKTGMKLMLSHPLTGVGMNRFSEGIGRDREERGLTSAKWQAPHNSFVQIGAETGIFGLFIFCMMSSNIFKNTGRVIGESRCEKLIKISEMARVGFLGHFVSAMFLSQAYSLYWGFYIVLSAVLSSLQKKCSQESYPG